MEDYSTVTELPGQRASREQLERLYHRYEFAFTLIKRMAVTLHLMPRTMKGKELLNLGIEEFRN